MSSMNARRCLTRSRSRALCFILPTAWLGSPFCGRHGAGYRLWIFCVSPVKVHRLDPNATVAELVAERIAELSPSGQQLLARVWPILEEAATTLGRTSFSAHLERTWLSLGGDAALSTERLHNVHRFFEVLRALEQEEVGYIDSATLNVRLSKLFAETAPDDTAVQLLTIHNSKGLEFDVVLSPGLERATSRSRYRDLELAGTRFRRW